MQILNYYNKKYNAKIVNNHYSYSITITQYSFSNYKEVIRVFNHSVF